MREIREVSWLAVICAIIVTPIFVLMQWTSSAASDPPVGVSEVDQPAMRVGNITQIAPTLPPPYQWTGPLPAGAPWGIPCTRGEASVLAAKMLAIGAGNSDIEFMLGVFGRESGCRYWVHNYNRATRDDSYSLCQLNAMSGHFGPNGVLYGWDRWRMLDDFVYAVDACIEMWTICGRGPWVKPYGCSVPEVLR